MGWVTDRETDDRHRCLRPEPQYEDVGRIWACNECGTSWRLYDAHRIDYASGGGSSYSSGRLIWDQLGSGNRIS